MKKLLHLIGCMSLCAGLNAQPFLNGSFETGGTEPDDWDFNPLGGDPDSEISYVTTGGAADGSRFVRVELLSSVGTFNFFTDYVRIDTDTQTLLNGNTRYVVTASFRRSNSDFVPVFSIDEVGGIQYSSNTAFEYFIIGRYQEEGSTSAPLNSWYEETFEFTTEPHGTIEAEYIFILTGRSFFNAGGGDTLDIDNVRFTTVEPLLDATITIDDSPGLYDFTNTDCRIDFLSNDTEGDVTVSKIEGTPSNIGTASVPGKYWDIDSEISGNFSAVPIFFYTDAELSTAGINENEINLIKRTVDGNDWLVVPATVDTTENTVQPIDPVSSFSQWAIASNGFPEGFASADNWNLYQ